MLTRVLSNRGARAIAFGRLAFWGALGVVGSAGTACSNFSAPCEESHTCTSRHPDAAAGAAESGATSGGNSGSGGSGAAGLGGGGGNAGTPASATPDGGNTDGIPDAGHAGDDAAGLECPPDRGDCDRDPTNGCEVDFSTALDHCGDCRTACADTGAKTRVCQQGVCKPICDATHADCNRDGKDGCEADLTSDAANCNACGQACPTDGTASVTCQDRACKPTCDGTHADCNGMPEDGCEIDLTTDTANCGACKHACGDTNTRTVACVASVCSPTCIVNFADCTPASPPPLKDDGCEANLATGATTCGACGHDCKGGGCTAGLCQPVPLAQGLKGPGGLVVDDTYIHWVDVGTTQYQVRRITLVGGAPTVVTDGVAISNVASDGPHVFWGVRDSGSSSTSDGSIVRIDTGKTAQTTIQTGIDPLGVSADSSHVFWRSDKDSAVYVAGHNPGDKATKLMPNITGVRGIVSDGSTAFVSTGGMFYLVPLAQGTVAMQGSLAGVGDPFSLSIAASKDNVYAWYNDGTSPFQLISFTKPAFGSPTPLAKSANAAYLPMVADDHYVYFAEQTGLSRVSTETKGAAAEHLVATGSVEALTVRGKILYWIELNSSGIGNAIQKLVTF